MIGSFGAPLGTFSREEPSLSGSWSLALRPGTHIRALRSEIATHLRVLERLHVLQFHESQAPHYSAHWAKDRLCQLGVEMGISSTELPPRITVGMGSGRWTQDPDALNDAVQPEVDDNIEKLRTAAADERHLFVWISTANKTLEPTMQSVVETGAVPSTPFLLPEGLDVLWVAGAGYLV